MANSKWQMADGKSQIADGKWQMANGPMSYHKRWLTTHEEDGEWY
jgi:hypothetical protein